MADNKSASWLIEFCITQGPSISVLGGVVHASRVVDSRHWTDIHYSQRQWCIYDIYEPSSWLNPPVLSAPLKPLPGVARLISCSLTAYLSHLPIYRFYRAKHIQHISVQRGICYGPLSVCPSVCHTLLLFLNSWTLFKHSTLNDIPADVNPITMLTNAHESLQHFTITGGRSLARVTISQDVAIWRKSICDNSVVRTFSTLNVCSGKILSRYSIHSPYFSSCVIMEQM